MNAFKNIRSLAGLNKYLWKYKLMLFWGMLFVIVSNFFAVVPAQIVRHSIDLLRDSLSLHRLSKGFTAQEVLESHVFKIIFFYALIILGMALMKGLFMFMMRQTIIVMSRKVEYDLKNEIYSHFQDLSLAFYRRNNTGDLMARITEDVSRVRMYLGPAIMYTINLVSLIILVITIMLSVNVELTLLVLLPLPILAVTIYYVNNITYEKSMGIQGQLSKLTTYVQEVFSGIRVVKSFAAEESVKGHFAGDVANYREKTLGLVKVESLFFPAIIFLIGLSTLITLYFGGIEVMEGSITPGVIAEFFIYVSLLSWPVAAIGWTTNLIQRAAASQARINELLKEKPDITDMGGKEISVEGHIFFENVSFTYPETGIEALRNVSLNIRPGDSLGIIGRTGSGKSTFANLLLRAYDTTTGKVMIDGTDIRELDLGVYHEQVGYVPQDDFLFSVSIADNILFGLNTEARKISTEKTLKLLHWAADVADVSKDVRDFPYGFETMLGERGITLSGGQKQRVAIARAIVHNPKLLILDDCFSAIDTNTEAVILQNLSEVMKEKTSIIISHRVSTVKNATHVIVLDNGQIVEQGNHDALMQKEGYYYMLYKKQLMEKELYERQKNTIG